MTAAAAPEQVLDALEAAGIPAAVVTNAPPSEMAFSLGRLVPSPAVPGWENGGR